MVRLHLARWHWFHRLGVWSLVLSAVCASAPLMPQAALVRAEGEQGATAHTVAPGETLYRIAARYGVALHELATANNILDPNTLWAGQTLFIPSPVAADPSASAAPPPAAPSTGTTHVVQRGENLFRIAMQYGVPVWALVQANGLGSPDMIWAGQVLTIPEGGQARPFVPLSAAVAAGGAVPTAPPGVEGVDFTPAPYFRITHYCLHGPMASGRWVYLGAVAADASVFGLGTRLLVEGLGFFTVEDRFAWDGREFRLDVWVPTCDEARLRGVQYRRVFQVISP